MERTRIQLADGVYLTYLPARKFKTSLLSAQFVTPLQQETASAYALLPAILRRGTVRYPDLGALSARLEDVYKRQVYHRDGQRSEAPRHRYALLQSRAQHESGGDHPRRRHHPGDLRRCV